MGGGILSFVEGDFCKWMAANCDKMVTPQSEMDTEARMVTVGDGCEGGGGGKGHESADGLTHPTGTDTAAVLTMSTAKCRTLLMVVPPPCLPRPSLYDRSGRAGDRPRLEA